ncbi:hypothetical protein ASF84_24665 [Pseudomonas sp. Leaf127]|uniref:hypothetical protein n=1 Tax=Pseudomonas sp. Leaf127 TaxID=1736267 RepID=UPI00070353E3|nr:hypothetical protein [Pseudomonas sp. Leaf127]KQQ66503.1 hypothetical protein ASF84_24665 [Pseudomonas sp. Leaf127]
MEKLLVRKIKVHDTLARGVPEHRKKLVGIATFFVLMLINAPSSIALSCPDADILADCYYCTATHSPSGLT